MLFNEVKLFILIDILFCEKNKNKSKDLSPSYLKWKIPYFNNMDPEEIKEFCFIKRQQ